MEHVPELVSDYQAMNPYARKLLRDLAKSFKDRFPTTDPVRKTRRKSTDPGPGRQR